MVGEVPEKERQDLISLASLDSFPMRGEALFDFQSAK